ncbi:cytochrome P450, partial [Neoconidiobolus thromboides FSU 785]
LILILNCIFVILLTYYIYNIIYNICFSPLKNVPGPLINLIFPFIHNLYLINGTFPEYALNMHSKYGSAVRISWSEVSFSSDSALKEIYSTYAYKKDQVYDMYKITGESTFSTRNKDLHRQRKKIIAPSFSCKVMQSAEYLVKKNVDTFVNKLDIFATKEQTFDLGLYFHYFAFDVIGDLVFGKSFNMLRDGYHPIVKWIHDISSYNLVVFMFPFMKYYQFDGIKKLYEFSYEAIKDARNNPERTSTLSTLIKAMDSVTGKHLTDKEIAEESILQIDAGTDTTSNSLSWIFYLLANNPEVYEKAKEEIYTIFPDKDSITYIKCKSECHYLNAIIHEGLRILPVAGGTATRIVPKGGRVIDGYYIPEEVKSITKIAKLNNIS